MIDATARFRSRIGAQLPGGTSWGTEGTNFSVHSQDAKNRELQLYETWESTEPFQMIALDQNTQRTFSAWHVFVGQLPVGICPLILRRRLRMILSSGPAANDR